MRTITQAMYVAFMITIACAVLIRNASADRKKEADMAKVTGIGGFFFLSRGKGKDLSAWYEKHLGFRLEEHGAAILRQEDDTAEDIVRLLFMVGVRHDDVRHSEIRQCAMEHDHRGLVPIAAFLPIVPEFRR